MSILNWLKDLLETEHASEPTLVPAPTRRAPRLPPADPALTVVRLVG